jgi:hypothetical protein
MKIKKPALISEAGFLLVQSTDTITVSLLLQ